jgi:hypothetical protein
LAILLLLGGIGFALFTWEVVSYWNPLVGLVLFGPNYLVTLGYLLRGAYDLSLKQRVALWSFSILAQCWLLVPLLIGATGGGSPGKFGLPCLIWSSTALLVSIFAVMTEQDHAPRTLPTDDDSM